MFRVQFKVNLILQGEKGLWNAFQCTAVDYNELKQHLKNQVSTSEKEIPKNQWRSQITSVGNQFRSKFMASAQATINQLNQAARMDRNLIRDRFFDSLKVYNSAIQALLEGRREIMRDTKAKLPDGSTVEDRVAQLQKLANNLLKKNNP